ncbi:HEAT repeat-containing protein 5B-like protein, partial [Corchorus olitorius]
SVVVEITFSKETATLPESVRFTQQLVLFAPSAASVHSHVQTLLLSLASRQVLAMSTGVSAGISNILGYNYVSGSDGNSRLTFADDDKNMVSSSHNMSVQGHTSEASIGRNRDKHLRYRTRVFAAECSSYLPEAVGKIPSHFDLSLARRKAANGQASCDWLVLQVQELISVPYQISTIQFENMRPIGVGLLSSVVDKFETVPDPELPGQVLLEQYQAQLISAGHTALDASSGPVLLEAGLQLATKGQRPTLSKKITPLASSKTEHDGDSPAEDKTSPGLKFYEIVLPVFQFLLTQKCFSAGFLTVDICEELLQVFSYSIYMDNSWNSLAVSVLSQVPAM